MMMMDLVKQVVCVYVCAVSCLRATGEEALLFSFAFDFSAMVYVYLAQAFSRSRCF